MNHYSGLLIGFFLIASCTANTNLQNLPGFENDLFKEFVQSGTLFDVLELENIPIHEYRINGVNKIKNDALETGITMASGIEMIGDKIIVNNRFTLAPVIAAFSKDGDVLHTRNLDGEGPGELRSIWKILRNNDQAFLYDKRLSKLALIDENLEIISSNIYSELSSSDQFATQIYNNYLILRASSNHSENLVKYFEFGADSLIERGSLMPRLIPFPKQPLAMNGVTISSNSHSLYAVYRGLPFVFRFDQEFNHRSWYLDEASYAEIDNPKVIAYESTDAARVSQFIGMVYATESHLFLTLSHGILAIFEISGDDLLPKARIQFFDEPQSEANPTGKLRPVDVTSDGIHLYFIDTFRTYIYKVSLSEIFGG